MTKIMKTGVKTQKCKLETELSLLWKRYLIRLQPVSSVEGLSACRVREEMKNFQAKKMHVLPVPLHVRLCWCTF